MSPESRLSGEIHDMVGHTLTTVLIEIEAAKKLLNKNPELAAKKLEMAEEQVRKGINSTRELVSILKHGNIENRFIPSMETLIGETVKHTGVHVKFKIEPITYLNKEQENFLYRALQEGLTNGILHGHCTRFIFDLKEKNNHVLFKLKDNGTGSEVITFGFGLTSMKEWVEELGGSLNISFAKGKGCCIYISIPIKEGENSEYYSGTGGRRPGTYTRWIEDYSGTGR